MPKKTPPAQLDREIAEALHKQRGKRGPRKRELHSPIDDSQAVDIANAWHSVMTWNDPGVAMYSVSSTGKIHSEKHRKQLLAYIATCIPQAQKLDARGEAGVVTESNVADLEALRDWVKAFPLKKHGGSTAHSTIATRNYEYVVYPEATHRNADRAVKIPTRQGKGPYDLTDAKREAKQMGAPAAIYSVSKGRFVGYVHPSGRYVTFR